MADQNNEEERRNTTFASTNYIPSIIPTPFSYTTTSQPQICTITYNNTLPHRSQHLSYTTVTQLPISTINHHIIPHHSQQLNYIPVDHCLPLISTI